jgi:hypothetical protein
VKQDTSSAFSPISLTANTSSFQLILKLQNGDPVGAYQINVSGSTLLSYLGFSASSFPGRYALTGTLYFLTATAPRKDLVTGIVSYSFPAQYLGEWIHKIAVGDQHTIVLTTDDSSCISALCCKFRSVHSHLPMLTFGITEMFLTADF